MTNSQNTNNEKEDRKQKFQLQMYRYGYTKENLFSSDSDLRTPITVLKVINQTLIGEKYSYPPKDDEYLETVYVTKEMAASLPKMVYMRASYDDGRNLYANEEDMLNEEKKPLLVSMGPGWMTDYISFPHILRESEMNRNHFEEYLVGIE